MRPEKHQLVHDICELLAGAPSLFLIAYKGLTVRAFSDLRAALEEAEARCVVVPNRLLKRAAAEAGLDGLAALDLAGDTALVTCGDGPVAVAKVLKEFARNHPEVAFKLGAVQGQLCTAEQAQAIADLPPREVLLAQLLGLLQAPARQLATVLNAKVASIVYVVSAYLKQKEEAA